MTMDFSLVVATCGRTDELELLFSSISRQKIENVEIIVVDQNADDRVIPIIQRFSETMEIKHIRSEIRNSSHARNLGLAAAIGDIIAFPDDDCVYPEGILSQVTRAFQNDKDLALLVGPSIGPAGGLGSGRWHHESGVPTMQTIWTSVIEFNMFAKSEWLRLAHGFDSDLGVGASFGSGEGVDLAIRIMRMGGKVFYDYSLRVIHPDKSLTQTAVLRAFYYGKGLGRVLRKHAKETGVFTILNFAIRPAGGILLSMLKSNFMAADYYWQTLRGRLAGYRAKLDG